MNSGCKQQMITTIDFENRDLKLNIVHFKSFDLSKSSPKQISPDCFKYKYSGFRGLLTGLWN